MKKQILTIITVLVLTLSLFTGCSMGGKVNLGDGSTSPAGTESNTTPDTSSAADNPANSTGTLLTIDKTNYAAGETIVVTYSGITSEMETAQSWVGIAKSGATSDSYLDWQYVKQGTGTVTLNVPTESGNYEVRFYQGYSANDENLVKSASVTFSVGDSTTANTSIRINTLTATSAAFVSMLAGDMYHIKTKEIISGVERDVEVYVKNGMYAQYYISSGMTTTTISRDGKTYTLYVDDKSYWVGDMPIDLTSTPFNTSDLTLAGSGTAYFGGKTLPYDEYTDAFGDKKQYFTDGNTLVGIRAIDSFDTQDTDVLALDQDIPDSVFDIPSNYTQRTPSPTSAPAPAVTLTTNLTLDQVKQNAQDAGYDVYDNFDYETRDGAPAAPDTGFCFGDSDLFMPLYIMEFKTESDAKAFADAMQSDVYHEYVQGKLVLEIEVNMIDDFTADMESQLVSALFK